MANENSNVSMDVVTGRRLDEALSRIWNALPALIAHNVDVSAIVTNAKAYCDSANRQVIGTTITEKTQALDASVRAMVQAFEEAGLSMTGITTAQFAQCIAALSNTSGCYWLDVNGIRWTAATWAAERERLGHDPALRAGILVDNPDHPFLVASKHYGQTMFGTYNHTIPNLQAFTGGVAGEPKSGEYNSWKIMAATNPENCRADRKVTYFAGMDDTDLVNKDVVFFPDEATLNSWAAEMGLGIMQAIGESMIYAVPHATTANAWVLKYCRQGTTTIQFQNREAVAPYTDSYGMVGCTALELCYAHREHEGDTTHWRLGSLFEYLLCYLNKAAIDECRIAGGEQPLPASEVWSCFQNGNGAEYYLSLATGAYGNGYKYNRYYVVPLAS